MPNFLESFTDVYPCQIPSSVFQNGKFNKIIVRTHSTRLADKTLPYISPHVLTFVLDLLKSITDVYLL